MKIVVVGLLLLLVESPAVVAESDAYTDTVAGMKCSQWEPGYQQAPQLDCVYKVGKGLDFSLNGIGQSDATWTVFRADRDGDYYVSFPTSTNKTHDCAIVKSGVKNPRVKYPDFAFVSPRSGKVFRTWPDCVR